MLTLTFPEDFLRIWKMSFVQQRLVWKHCLQVKTAFEVTAWMSNRSPYKSMDVISNPSQLIYVSKKRPASVVTESRMSHSPGLEIAKPTFYVSLFTKYFSITKTRVGNTISRLYLTGVTTCQLRRYLLNMNGSSEYLIGIFVRSTILLMEKLTNGDLVAPNPWLMALGFVL